MQTSCMKLSKAEKTLGKKNTEEYIDTVMSSHGLAIRVSNLWGFLNPKMVPGAEITGQETFFHLLR